MALKDQTTWKSKPLRWPVLVSLFNIRLVDGVISRVRNTVIECNSASTVSSDRSDWIMRKILALGLVTLCVSSLAAIAASQKQPDAAAKTLELVEAWIGGTYDNSAQTKADIANNVPEDQRFTALHQYVVPVELEAFEGLNYFSQLSNDGTTDTLLGIGIYQFLIDDESGQVVMRYHVFNESEPYTNAHLDLSKLDGVTLEDVHNNEGCKFYLSPNEDGTQIDGVMEENACFPISRATGTKIKHEDVFIVKPGELWNDAKYFDLDGNLLFGNKTGDYQKQVRIAD